MASPLRSVESELDLDEALATLPTVHHAVILVGGATFADDAAELVSAIRRFLASLARACQDTGTAVVDGGTDAGVMRWFAEARAAIDGTFPLVGVAPRDALARTTRTGAPIEPAAGHTLILAVPGSRFGDETDWLFRAADRLASGGAPAIVVNGGAQALAEARARLDAGHLVLAVGGSGRAADELAVDGDLPASGRLRVVPVTAGPADLASSLQEAAPR